MEVVYQLAEQILRKHWRMVTAESCTGGGLAQLCTALPGSSQWFDRGFVTYSQQAKVDCLGVEPELFAKHSAVSAACAQAMAVGALQVSGAQLALSTTGYAGPAGGTLADPVGTIYLGWAFRGSGKVMQHQTLRLSLKGDRQKIRAQAIEYALGFCLQCLK